jgi:predicted amidophosphoribosyltransferase
MQFFIRAFKNLLKVAEYNLFDRKCIVCNKELLLNTDKICSICWNKINFIYYNYNNIFIPLEYNLIVKDLLWKFKYKKKLF